MRAVVQVQILFQRAVPARLHHQLAVHPRLAQLDALVDDVLVAALVAAVLAAELRDKVGQAVGGDAVGDDGAAGELAQRDRRH